MTQTTSRPSGEAGPASSPENDLYWQRPLAREVQPDTDDAPSRYTLAPEKRAKAIAYARANYLLYFASVTLSAGVYFFLWRAKLSVLFRSWARRVASNLWVQGLVFVPLLWAAVNLLKFPLDYYARFVLEHKFDLSSQSLGSWLADRAKGFGVGTVFGVVVVSIFYEVVRRSSRRWWFYFWVLTLPIVLASILLHPYVVDPLYFRFRPLETAEPFLTTRIEAMLRSAGLNIPRPRILEMDASTKTKALDAYVAGIGPSKRVVVWDNTLHAMGADETLLVVAHEAGHYVLHHIPKEFALIELVALAFFYLGFMVLTRVVPRGSAETGVESLSDLASLPLVLLVLTLLVFLSSPIINGISRHYEHQADQFAIEAARGVVADPNAAEVRAFEVLGEKDLADPDPNPFIRFWLYSHPPLDERIRFAAAYKPWAQGKPPKFVRLAR